MTSFPLIYNFFMKKNIRFYQVINSLLFFIIITLNSCSGIVSSINGEKRPKLETIQSLNKFIKDNNLSIELDRNIFLKNKEAKMKLINSELVYKKDESTILPYGIILFDENGLGYNYSAIENCLIDEIKSDSISNFSELNSNKNNFELNLTDLNYQFLNNNGKDFSSFKINNKPTVIILWAKYRGKKWAKETNSMINSFKSSPKNYNIYFLNLDPNKYYSQFN